MTSRWLSFFWALALLFLSAARSHAAFTLPPEIENASEEEKAKYLREVGERSLNEKRIVGYQRYNDRKAYRQALANNLRANYERRADAVMNQFSAPPKPASDAVTRGNSYQTWILWIGVLIFAGIWIYHRYFEEHPEDHYTVVVKGSRSNELKTYDLD